MPRRRSGDWAAASLAKPLSKTSSGELAEGAATGLGAMARLGTNGMICLPSLSRNTAGAVDSSLL